MFQIQLYQRRLPGSCWNAGTVPLLNLLQVLWQKAFITEMAKQKNAKLQTEARVMNFMQHFFLCTLSCWCILYASMQQKKICMNIHDMLYMNGLRWTPLEGTVRVRVWDFGRSHGGSSKCRYNNCINAVCQIFACQAAGVEAAIGERYSVHCCISRQVLAPFCSSIW